MMKLIIYDNHFTSDFSGLKINNNILTIEEDCEETIIIEGKNNDYVKLTINVINANIKMIECQLEKVEITLNISRNGFLNYQSINTLSYTTKKLVNIYGNSYFKYEQIDINEVTEDIIINLLAENANTKVKYLVVNTHNNSNIRVLINHLAKNTFSEVNNYGIAIDNANVNFEITGKIAKGQSKSSCIQLTRGIIIGNQASILAKPILLIDEYDVKAYHGASIGKMSEEDLFYLMSRGLTKAEAFKLILSGTINPFTASIINENIKQKIILEINKLIEG